MYGDSNPYLNLNEHGDCDEVVVAGHDYDYYLNYCCYFAEMIDVGSFSYSSFVDFETKFLPKILYFIKTFCIN